MAQTHEDQCTICNVLSPEDIKELEVAALKKKESYESIADRMSEKYDVSITKQQISNHMIWLRAKKLAPKRDEILEEHGEKILNTLDEYLKVHQFAWDKIKELEELKNTRDVTELLRVANAQDRYLKSLLKGLRLFAELTGEAERDTRKLEISVVLKRLKEEMGEIDA